MEVQLIGPTLPAQVHRLHPVQQQGLGSTAQTVDYHAGQAVMALLPRKVAVHFRLSDAEYMPGLAERKDLRPVYGSHHALHGLIRHAQMDQFMIGVYHRVRITLQGMGAYAPTYPGPHMRASLLGNVL